MANQNNNTDFAYKHFSFYHLFFFYVAMKYVKNKNSVHLTSWNHRVKVAFKITSFSTSMINILIFRCANPKTEDYFHYFADQLTQNNSPSCLYNKKLSFLCLIRHCGKRVMSMIISYLVICSPWCVMLHVIYSPWYVVS